MHGAGTIVIPGLLRMKFFSGELLRGGQSVGGGDFDVGLDASAFPIGVGDGINGAREGDTDSEVLGDAVAADRVRTASGGFADDGGALERLEVIGELFATGKSFFGGQHERWFAVEPLAGNVLKRPILVGDVPFASPEVVQMGAFGKEIR